MQNTLESLAKIKTPHPPKNRLIRYQTSIPSLDLLLLAVIFSKSEVIHALNLNTNTGPYVYPICPLEREAKTLSW